MRICLASDFFYPNTGGVEAHIWQLGQCLVDLGHQVIVITHSYDNCTGIKYMPNRLKVYYLPFSLYNKHNIKWPFIFNTFTKVRQILIYERINIVHGHSAFSPIAHEVMFHAKTLGINTVFTDHSLFGFNDIGSIIHTQIVKLSLLQCNHIICVSHVGKRNKALHLEIQQDKTIPITVIPNAVDTQVFTPDPSQRDPNKITIVVNSRLVYRKGIDLLAAVLPKICLLSERVHLIIAGDGPKRVLLETAVQQYDLHDRVTFLGAIPHDRVRDILVKGDIFLNTSLIEAFCMAIVEAASCGLQVVSTDVGGLPEVLPPKLIKLTEPSVEGLVSGVKLAIEEQTNHRTVPPDEAHKIIEETYSWEDVARRTQQVYESVLEEPILSFKDRLYRYPKANALSLLFVVLILINQIILLITDWLQPRSNIGYCPESALTLNGKNGLQKHKPTIATYDIKSKDLMNGYKSMNGDSHHFLRPNCNGVKPSRSLVAECREQPYWEPTGIPTILK